MTDTHAPDETDYGPLTCLIGHWYGDQGMDVAPEEDGPDKNPYFENITFTAIGDVENAEQQTLAALHYVQVVQRKSNKKVFHHETGYWMWDAATNLLMHSLVIPRAVGILAAGEAKVLADGSTRFNVKADVEQVAWNIVQSPFMHEHAKTKTFAHQIDVNGDELRYRETMLIDIYGRQFEHSDENRLTRQL